MQNPPNKNADTFENDLKQAQTLEDIFNVCRAWYKTEETRPGILTRGSVIGGIKQAVKILKPPPR